MTFPARLLTEGERVVVSTRTHARVLVGPVAVLLVTVFVGVFLAAEATRRVADQTLRGALLVALAAAAVLALGRWVLRPFLRWYTRTYTFTDRRFVARSGLVAREGRTIPLNQISGVDFEQRVTDRVFGCGTLVVSDASEDGRVALTGIPRVEAVHTLVAGELHRRSGAARDERNVRE